jgi:very-short-patch-repair endonuclease
MRAIGRHDGRTSRLEIARFAERQHGVLSRTQAIEAGMHASAVERRLRTRQWESVDYGVYRVAGTPPSWRQRLMAACLAGPAVASHRSAAALWGFVDCGEDVVEVTALRHRRRHSGDIVWHESRHLDPADITETEGIPITRPLRTVLDLGVVCVADRIEELIDDGLRRGWFSTTAISRRWEQLGGELRPGGRVVQAVLERKAAGARPVGSILETRFRQLLHRAGLPEPASQYEVRVGGELVARVDFAFPELGIVIEVDGEERHTGRSPRKHDARRERRLVALGFRVLRFHWDDVHKAPTGVAREIAALIRQSA